MILTSTVIAFRSLLTITFHMCVRVITSITYFMITQEFSANLNWLCTKGFAMIQRMICLVNETHTFGIYIRFPHSYWLSEWSGIKRFLFRWWIMCGWLETQIVHHSRHFLYDVYEERKMWKEKLLCSLII